MRARTKKTQNHFPDVSTFLALPNMYTKYIWIFLGRKKKDETNESEVIQDDWPDDVEIE